MPEATFIYKTVVVTLATIIVAMVGVMLYGLFDVKIDNEQVFKIIGPAFQTVIGAFVGILSARALGKESKP